MHEHFPLREIPLNSKIEVHLDNGQIFTGTVGFTARTPDITITDTDNMWHVDFDHVSAWRVVA